MWVSYSVCVCVCVCVCVSHQQQQGALCYTWLVSFDSGITPVVVQPPAASNLHGSLPVLKTIVELSSARAILSTHNIIKMLRSKVESTVHKLLTE